MDMKMNAVGVDKVVMSCVANPVTKCSAVLVLSVIWARKVLIRLSIVRIGSAFSVINSPYTICVSNIKL